MSSKSGQGYIHDQLFVIMWYNKEICWIKDIQLDCHFNDQTRSS